VRIELIINGVLILRLLYYNGEIDISTEDISVKGPNSSHIEHGSLLQLENHALEKEVSKLYKENVRLKAELYDLSYKYGISLC